MIRVIDYPNQRCRMSVSESFAEEFINYNHGEGIVAIWKVIDNVRYIVLVQAYTLIY